jgi:hypothetical protein
VKQIIKKIYGALRNDAEAEDGVLAQSASTWESLQKGYNQAFDATSRLEPILKRSKAIESEPKPAPTELDDATGRMVDRRRDWLAKIADFQKALSAFYKELGPAEEKTE